jgi:hypothetical protein
MREPARTLMAMLLGACSRDWQVKKSQGYSRCQLLTVLGQLPDSCKLHTLPHSALNCFPGACIPVYCPPAATGCPFRSG